MSLIIPAPTPAIDEPAIVSGPFWPDVDPAKVRDTQRIDGTVPAPRLKTAIIEAIAATNGELKAWREKQQAAGCSTLADVAAEEIDGTSILIHRYQRAVGCHTKALLLERLRDFDSTAKGDKKADALTDPIDDLWRDYRHAIADITGAARSTVELI
ncbi:MAG TPA: head completion/stabilization protein [Rhodocyclaceae bacterium]|nr:head completion/stabilization protein [Rhodocyclaceae bacterium]